MTLKPELYSTDICILGAGPAGISAALTLAKQNINCIVIDKKLSPKDKICGDGLSGKSISCLKKLDPELLNKIRSSGNTLDSWGVTFIAPNQKKLNINLKPRCKDDIPGFTIKRTFLDKIMIEEAREKSEISLHEGIKIRKISKLQDHYELTSENNEQVYHARLLLLATGAEHIPNSELFNANGHTDDFIAVRAYYKNVTGFREDNSIEMFFIKDLLPCYLWIFPLKGGGANVGLGVKNKDLKKFGKSLKCLLFEAIQNEPQISERFKDAEMEGKVAAYKIPIFHKKLPLSGDGYMLLGDAAFLVDPLTGEGIGNAMYSGILAGEAAAKCIAENNFTKIFLRSYDKEVYTKLGSELKTSYRLHNKARKAYLLNMVISQAARSPKLRDSITDMVYDFNKSRYLGNPIFQIKYLIKKYIK